MPVVIRKVTEPFGWLGNMSPFPIVYNGETYRTSEALFQALRFQDGDILQLIRDQTSPMAVKMVLKKHRDKMVVEPMSSEDVDNMRLVLRLKLEQHPELKEKLAATAPDDIIEDCTNRPRGSGLFWGAALKDDHWVGDNWLGKLWMELRDQEKLANSGVQ